MGKSRTTLDASALPMTKLAEEEQFACLNIFSGCGFGGIGINLLKGRDPADLEPSETDALMAKELNKLTMEQRERVFEEIHGVADVISSKVGIDVTIE